MQAHEFNNCPKGLYEPDSLVLSRCNADSTNLELSNQSTFRDPGLRNSDPGNGNKGVVQHGPPNFALLFRVNSVVEDERFNTDIRSLKSALGTKTYCFPRGVAEGFTVRFICEAVGWRLPSFFIDFYIPNR